MGFKRSKSGRRRRQQPSGRRRDLRGTTKPLTPQPPPRLPRRPLRHASAATSPALVPSLQPSHPSCSPTTFLPLRSVNLTRTWPPPLASDRVGASRDPSSRTRRDGRFARRPRASVSSPASVPSRGANTGVVGALAGREREGGRTRGRFPGLNECWFGRGGGHTSALPPLGSLDCLLPYESIPLQVPTYLQYPWQSLFGSDGVRASREEVERQEGVGVSRLGCQHSIVGLPRSRRELGLDAAYDGYLQATIFLHYKLQTTDMYDLLPKSSSLALATAQVLWHDADSSFFFSSFGRPKKPW